MATLLLSGGAWTLGIDTPGFFSDGTLSGSDDIDSSPYNSLVTEGAATSSYVYTGVLTGNVSIWHTAGSLEITSLPVQWTGGLTIQGGTVILDAVAPTKIPLFKVYAGATLTLNSDMSGAAGIDHTILLSNAGIATIANAGHTVELKNVISGSAASTLLLNGGGTTIFSSNNTYSGQTRIAAGTTLQLGAGGATGDLGSGNSVGNAGALTINHSNAITIAEVITGTGTLTQSGAGTTTLSGTNTYSGTTTISSGTLQIGNGATSGTLGSGAVTDNATLTFNHSDTLTAGNTISGTGKVIQAGSGTLRLAGTSSFSGGTDINTGTLDLAAASAAGTGQINFKAGAQTLALEAAAFSGGDLANVLMGFGNEDTIDLVGITASATTLGGGNVLSITTAGGTRTLHLDAAQSFTGQIFQTSSDGAGGTFLKLAAPPAPVPVVAEPVNPWVTNTYSGHDVTVNVPSALSTTIATTATDTLIYSVMQPLTLPEGFENIVLSGGGGRNTIKGNAADNIFTVTSGDWMIEGGGGHDAVVYQRPESAYTVSPTGTGFLVVGPEGTQSVSNVSALLFSDKRIDFDTSGDAAMIYSVYQAAYGRAADAAGEAYWLDWMHAGHSSADVAKAFVNSSEFQIRYSAQASDTTYVTALYQNVLHRAPDASGLAYWSAMLGRETRAQMLTDFAMSPENQNYVKVFIGQGVPVEHALV